MLRVALEGRSLPVVHGCGWDSGAARERSSALAASVASRYALGADGVGAARPGARGSRVTASRYALGAEGGGAARPGAYMCPPRNCARCLLGGVGMSKKSCAARCSRGSVQGVLRAPAEGVALATDLLVRPPGCDYCRTCASATGDGLQPIGPDGRHWISCPHGLACRGRCTPCAIPWPGC